MLRKPCWLTVSVAVALLVVAPTNYSLIAVTTGVEKSIATALLPKNPLSTPSCAIPGGVKAMKAGVWINVSDDKRVRKLEGADAEDFLARFTEKTELSKKFHKEAHEKAKAKGWKKAAGPDGDMLLFHVQKRSNVAKHVEQPTSLIARVANFFFPIASAQYVDGYVDEGFWWANSYDDGNLQNWEGVYGGYEYAYGNYAEGVMQFTLDGVGGATLDYDDGGVMYPGFQATAQGGFRRFLIASLGCSVGGCTTFALGCAWLGPATLGCAGLGCAASVIGCGVGTMLVMALESNDPCYRDRRQC
jgi:hypothetical protein